MTKRYGEVTLPDSDPLGTSKIFKFDTQKFMRKIQDNQVEIICNVCHNIPRPDKVLGCIERHVLCEPCHDQLDKCPKCREKNFSYRLRTEEHIIQSLDLKSYKYLCKHSKCNIATPFPFITQHQYLCKHRYVMCPAFWSDKQCNWSGTAYDLQEHIFEQGCAIKSPTLISTTSDLKNISYVNREYRLVSKPILINEKSAELAGNITIQSFDDGFFFLVYVLLLSSKEVAHKYKTKISVTSNYGSREVNFTYTGPINFMDMSRECISTKGNCLHLNKAKFTSRSEVTLEVEILVSSEFAQNYKNYYLGSYN